MRYKERPCPGCGNVDEQPPQTLCANCQRQLKLGKKREEELESWEESGETIRIALDTKFRYSSGAFVSFLSIRDWDVLDALVRLGGLDDAHGSRGLYAEARLIHYDLRRPGGYGSRPHHYVFATHEQADDIELILDYIKLVIEKAYSDGQANGRNLILRLATAGADDLNRITTGVTE